MTGIQSGWGETGAERTREASLVAPISLGFSYDEVCKGIERGRQLRARFWTRLCARAIGQPTVRLLLWGTRTLDAWREPRKHTRACRRSRSDLTGLSDHLLSDIGIHRSELSVLARASIRSADDEISEGAPKVVLTPYFRGARVAKAA